MKYGAWSTGELQDGDVYDVTLARSDGTTIVDAHPTASYVILRPNGEGCGPVCHQATITL